MGDAAATTGRGDRAVSLSAALARFDDLWSPRIVAAVNDYDVKIAKIHGAFQWHTHADTDEFFLVVDGAMRLDMEGREPIEMDTGDVYVVPRGVSHRPVADHPASILMFEPTGTRNTGDNATEGTTGRPLD